jgi:hypothetical protein
MSNSSDHTKNSDDLSLYAPKWARDTALSERHLLVRKIYDRDLTTGNHNKEHDEPENQARIPESADQKQQFFDEIEENVRKLRQVTPYRELHESDEGFIIDNFRVPRSLDPDTIPEPWPPQRHARKKYSAFGIFGRLALAVSAAAAIALVLGKLSFPWGISSGEARTDESSFLARFSSHYPKQVEPPQHPTLELTPQAAASAPEEALPLGAAINGMSSGAALVVSGLPNGAALSVGRPVGLNGWRVSAPDVSHTTVRAPRGFSGAIDLVVELRLADDTVAQKQAARFEWPAPVVKAAALPTAAPDINEQSISSNAAPSSEPTNPAARQLDSEEIAILLKRGEEFVSVGDFSAARIVLRRAAEAGNPRAALALAATFDPIVLAKLGVKGITPDVAMARNWYERAKEFGSSEATGRLDMLASRDR